MILITLWVNPNESSNLIDLFIINNVNNQSNRSLTFLRLGYTKIVFQAHSSCDYNDIIKERVMPTFIKRRHNDTRIGSHSRSRHILPIFHFWKCLRLSSCIAWQSPLPVWKWPRRYNKQNGIIEVSVTYAFFLFWSSLTLYAYFSYWMIDYSL